ncbi:MAG: helix-turn-helix domain-containing protein, partial [Candidatus Promineifilaceae bacterium]
MAESGEPLSERERVVLERLADGSTNRQIAHDLDISPNTVKVHLRNIFAKLGVSSRTEAAAVALQRGLLSLPALQAGN